MRDFDKERAERAATLDRVFQINGREFRFRKAVRPETFARVADLQIGSYRDSFPIPESDREGEGPLTVWRGPTEIESVGILDGIILEFLEPDSHADWRAVREDVDDPVTASEMWDLVAFMVEVQSGRPTTPASNSGGGGQENGTRSTEGLPSPEAISKA